jgi:cellulose synthase/poly-beta-1,6-N-acetylglucosamine synthase-like glycosyltransferase
MLADLFYLSVLWLVLGFIALLALGRHLRHSGFFSSLLYLVILVGVGDLIALLWLGEDIGLVVISSIIIVGAGMLLFLMLKDWNAAGQAFFLFSITATLMYLLYAFAVTAFSPTSPLAFIFSFLLFLLETAVLALSLSYAFEVLDALCRVNWRHTVSAKPLGAYAPMVSIQVPAYNEPPELVEKTLRALAKLDYPSYEVILIDNNTPEEATWQPLEKICRELGFKCLHLDHWPGYKSGALNFALAMTDPRAEMIAVIDADYIVEPEYLRRIVPYFEDPKIAFVQTPQNYRDFEQTSFFKAVYDGYQYFFALSMPSRNEHNAIIFCGTMGLLRKQVLQEIGGWDEWCITEDAETSLRKLNRGYKSLYINETFGHGLMPLDFEGLKKQRFRWAFGSIQILKKHWRKLMPWAHWVDPANQLTGAQRYFYLLGGLQWFNELFTFAFTVMVVISAVLTITGQTSFLRPTTEAFAVLPIVLIGTSLLRALWGLRHALSISWKRAFYALTLWFGLTWVVTLACIQALVQKRGVFLRTPKGLTDAAWKRALQVTSWETTIGITCLLAGLGVILSSASLFTYGLLMLCLSQALIYLSAPFHSLLSLGSLRGQLASQPDRANISGNVAHESRLGVQIGLVAATMLIFVFAASLLPTSDRRPLWYSIYNPEPLIIPKAQPFLKLDPDKPSKEPHKPAKPDKPPKGPKNKRDETQNMIPISTATPPQDSARPAPPTP